MCTVELTQYLSNVRGLLLRIAARIDEIQSQSGFGHRAPLSLPALSHRGNTASTLEAESKSVYVLGSVTFFNYPSISKMNYCQ